jgi:hypothetical protein
MTITAIVALAVLTIALRLLREKPMLSLLIVSIVVIVLFTAYPLATSITLAYTGA